MNALCRNICFVVLFLFVTSAASQEQSSTWSGRWSGGEGFVYDFEMELTVNGDEVSGGITWTLKTAPASREDVANRIGDSAVENVTGSYDASTGKLTLTGNSVSDATLIATDVYSIDISGDGDSFSGVTKGNEGSWTNPISGTLTSGSIGGMKESGEQGGNKADSPSGTVFDSNSLTKVAQKLAAESKYKPTDGQTFCSDFVRDFARELTANEIVELKGRAGQQFDQLKKASESDDGAWRSLSVQTDPARAFKEAQELANEGRLVIVAYKNPSPTQTNSGHIAVVVKHEWNDESLSTKWGRVRVPFIAQAGNDVSSSKKLSEGFSADLKDEIEIFVLK